MVNVNNTRTGDPSESERLYRVEEAVYMATLTQWREDTIQAQKHRTEQGALVDGN